VKQYAICNRGTNGDKVLFDHMEDAINVIFDAYWTRFGSQFRGVSPLTTAINRVQDLDEAFEYNLVKAKMCALFGVAIMRAAEGGGELGGGAGVPSEGGETSEPPTAEEMALNPKSINMLDLNEGDKVDTIESGTPTSEFVEGSHLFIQIAMLALDVPVTAFDSRRSSFSARIADLNEYEVSSESKRTKNRYVRTEYSDWVLATIWNDPASEWKLKEVATAAGMSLVEVQTALEWIPAGSPWLDKFKQVKGDELAIELRVDNAQDAAKRRGTDAFRNVDKQLQLEKYETDQRASLELPERVQGDPTKYDIDSTGTTTED
jgi:capsid protein